MKYDIGDLVVLKPLPNEPITGSTPMQILGFDEKRGKYRCLSFDYTDIVPVCIILTPERAGELATAENAYLPDESLDIMRNYRIRDKREILRYHVYEYFDDGSYKTIK